MWPSELLMVSPDYFTVDYAINPHMKDASGQLKKVDQGKALQQWMILRDTFKNLGMKMQILNGGEHFPDMVFCANAFFPFTKNSKKAALLSRMCHPERQGESQFFKKWLNENDFQVFELPNGNFEGMGDLLWNYETREVFGGYGYRTDLQALRAVEKIIEQPIHKLQLVDPDFYHLDTAMMILDLHHCLYVKEAFSDESQKTIEEEFRHSHPISKTEAGHFFALNGVALKGKNVVLPKGSIQTEKQLKTWGFKIHWVNTSEFIKAGGSAFCLKICF